MKRLGLIAGVVVLLAVAGLAWYATRDVAGSKQPSASSPSALPTRAAEPTPTPAPSAAPCSRAKPFTPQTLTVRGVTDSRPVVSIPRDPNGVPGVPPLSDAGKREFAFDPDQDVWPGDRRGNVLLNAHTWPDGSGLGNQLLAGAHRGTRIVVAGGGHRLCYRVTRRIEVDATKPQPAYFVKDGRPQLAIVVCSGERLGPGEWTKRTIWYASPGA
jgi:hypothetical protein